jgi:hypothetical protein
LFVPLLIMHLSPIVTSPEMSFPSSEVCKSMILLVWYSLPTHSHSMNEYLSYGYLGGGEKGVRNKVYWSRRREKGTNFPEIMWFPISLMLLIYPMCKWSRIWKGIYLGLMWLLEVSASTFHFKYSH